MSTKAVIKLTRFAVMPEGTLGRMNFPSGAQLYTIERPWIENRPFVSCIPAGVYQLEQDLTGRVHGPRLRAVPGRSQINIHPANKPHELQGCIAPGLDWRVDYHTPMVTSSNEAMAIFNEYAIPRTHDRGPLLNIDGEEIWLLIE